MAYNSLEEILEVCRESQIPFWETILQDDMNERKVTKEESFEKMMGMWRAMLSSSEAYDEKLISNSGLVGGSGGIMEQYIQKEHHCAVHLWERSLQRHCRWVNPMPA